MSYMLRDRPDGQFEIVLTRPILVGIFPEKDVASRVMFFLQEDEIELIEDEPASFSQALRDTAAAEAATQAALQDVIETPEPSPPPDALACARGEGCAAHGGLQAPERSRAGKRLCTDHIGRKAICRGAGFWPERWAAAIRLGAAMPRDPAAPGRGRSGALQALPQGVHTVDFGPRHLRSVQP